MAGEMEKVVDMRWSVLGGGGKKGTRNKGQGTRQRGLFTTHDTKNTKIKRGRGMCVGFFGGGQIQGGKASGAIVKPSGFRGSRGLRMRNGIPGQVQKPAPGTHTQVSGGTMVGLADSTCLTLDEPGAWQMA